MIRNKICSSCGVQLTKENVYLSDWKRNRSTCKKCSIQKTKDWWKNHSQKREYSRIKRRCYYKKIKSRIMGLLGNKCAICGISDFRVLQIDHVNNNGYEERKGNGGMKQYLLILRKLKSGSNDYQLLCANCNQIKKYKYHKSRLLVNSQKKNLKR